MLRYLTQPPRTRCKIRDRMRRRSAVVGMFVSVALTGCSCGGTPAKKPEGPHGPQIPTDFVPPPALGGEPKPNASAFGYAWLEAVHPAFHARWADSFLED